MDIKNPSNKTTGEEKGISDKVFNATAFEFFAAGFETSSTLMSYALFELAQHQDIQQKLRGEIVEVLQQTGGSITYEALNDMKYLDKVVKGERTRYEYFFFLSYYPPTPECLPIFFQLSLFCAC